MTSNPPRRFVIDTDTASDDAVALVMALRHPDVRVEAITVVAGNVGLEQAVQNALYTVEICGGDVPVYAGAEAPVARQLRTAHHIHGTDGFGDIGLSLTGREPAGNDGALALAQTIDRHAGEITMVTLGPLTNVAHALRLDPELPDKVSACYLMGGVGQGPGNITLVAEFNIWVDPEAARAVFESGLPIHMIGWDIANGFAHFEPSEAEALRALGTPLAEFCVDIQRSQASSRAGGFTLPDPTTMAVAIDPAVATEVRRLHVAIETESDLCRGQTVVDHVGVTKQEPNVDVVLEIDRDRFLELLRRSVR